MRPCQRRTLAALHHLAWSKGYAPDLRELAERTRVSTTRIHQILDDLRQAGLVTWEAGKSRTLRLTPDGLEAVAPRGDRPLPTTTYDEATAEAFAAYDGSFDQAITIAKTILDHHGLPIEGAIHLALQIYRDQLHNDDGFPGPQVAVRLAEIAAAIDKLRGPTEDFDYHLGGLAEIAAALGKL